MPTPWSAGSTREAHSPQPTHDFNLTDGLFSQRRDDRCARHDEAQGSISTAPPDPPTQTLIAIGCRSQCVGCAHPSISNQAFNWTFQ